MKKAKILILGEVNDDALAELKEKCEVVKGPEGHRIEDDRQWVIDHIADYDGVIVAKMWFDKEMLDHAKNLKIISTYGVGYDHVDVDYAKSKGIIVSNCPVSVRRPTAELALMLILACARRLHFYDHSIREGVFLDTGDYDNQGFNIEGKTLGIFGMGSIGQLVAQFAQALGMKIIYHNRHQLNEDIEKKLNAKYVDFNTLIKEADFLSLHAPLTDETKHIIDKNVFKKMKKNAFLINTARGAVVNETDLLDALKHGDIEGAGLDVFEGEPHINPEFSKLDNTILTPHVGSATHVGRYNLTKEAANNIISFFVDQKAINEVN